MLSQIDQINHIRLYHEQKDPKDLQILIDSNIRLINKMAFGFISKNKNLSFQDLQSAGTEGLIHAVNKFKEEESDAFLPYAKLWIKAKMNQYVQSVVSILTIDDTAGRKLFSNFAKYSHEVEAQGLPATIENISKHSYIKPGHIADYISAVYPTASLYFNDEESEERLALTSSFSQDQEFEKHEAYSQFRNEVSVFENKIEDENEKFIWQKRGINTTPLAYGKIAKVIGLTAQRVYAIDKKLLEKFKKQVLKSDKKDLFHSILELG